MDKNESLDMVSAFAAGEESAFYFFYEKYNPLLRYFAWRYLNDTENVNDIIQEVFIKLWEVRAIFKEEKSLRSYLYKTTKTLCLNQLRHQKVEDKYAATLKQGEEQDFFLENMLETELFGMVLKVYDAIPGEACKEVYRLSLSGLKHEQIANKLKITVNSVKKYKNRANHFMKEKLKKLFPD